MKRKKNSKKQILAGVVVGLNCVNSLTPMATAIMEQPVKEVIKPCKEAVAEPEQYTAACYQALDVADKIVFGTAEAHFTEHVGKGGSCTTSSVTGETVEVSAGVSVQNISAGGTATNGIIASGGTQNIYAGGIGNVSTMITHGYQGIRGGTGNVSTMNGGYQNISGGTGTVDTMSNSGLQWISAGGTGTVSTMSDGRQNIVSNAIGNVSVMRGGIQNIVSGGTGNVATMSGGIQNIDSGCIGNVTIMSGGIQWVSSGGTGTVTTICSDGYQGVLGGIGNVTTISSSGHQAISAGGTGTVATMMSGGIHDIHSGGVGTVNTMSGGIQNIYSGGTGTVNTMSGGIQYVKLGGTSLNTTVKDGIIAVYNKAGCVKNITMDGGIVRFDGSGANYNLTGNFVARGGVVDLTTDVYGRPQTSLNYETLTIDNLSGNGATFLMNTDLKSETDGDKLVIKAATANAGGTIQVYDRSLILGRFLGPKKLLLVTDNSGITAWKGKSLDTGGLWMITPTIEKEGSNWYLKLANTPVVRPGSGNNQARADNTLKPPAPVVQPGTDNTSKPPAPVVQPGTDNTPKPPAPVTTPTPSVKTIIFTPITPPAPSIKSRTFIPDATTAPSIDPKTIVPVVTTTPGVDPKTVTPVTTPAPGIDPKTSTPVVTTTPGVDPKTTAPVVPSVVPTAPDTDSKTPTPVVITAPDVDSKTKTLVAPPVPSIAPNPVAKTLVAFSDTAYGAWRNAIADDTLRMRLGDLRYNEAEEGVWARVKAGKLGAPGYKASYQMYQLGIDKQLANTIYGVAVDHRTGSNDYQVGNGKNSMTNLSFYATNYHPSGIYNDIVLKAGKYNGDVKLYSTNDSADYGTWGYSASYELGKTITNENGFFVEPEVQFILGRLQGVDYITRKGISANSDATTSFLGRVGFVAGRKLPKGGDYYFKANLWREFTGNGDINLSAVNKFGHREYQKQSASHRDTWFTMGLGGNVKLAKMTHLYGDIEKTFGADIQKKWQVNAGIRWEF